MAHKASAQQTRESSVHSKTCSQCAAVLPSTEFYAGHARCKPCYKIKNKTASDARRATRPKRQTRATTPLVNCSGCKTLKPRSSFSDRPDRPGYPNAHCKKCRSVKAAEWGRANPEKAREAKKTWAARNPEKAQAKNEKARRDTPRAKRMQGFKQLGTQLPDTQHVVWLKKLIKAKRKKSKGTLDAAWLSRWSLVQHCPIVGLPFLPGGSQLNGVPHPLTPSLDRIDPAAGYTPENTRVISYFANVSKNAWPEDQFKLLLAAAASNMRH